MLHVSDRDNCFTDVPDCFVFSHDWRTFRSMRSEIEMELSEMDKLLPEEFVHRNTERDPQGVGRVLPSQIALCEDILYFKPTRIL